MDSNSEVIVPISFFDDGLFFSAFKHRRKFRFVKMEGDVLMKVWEQSMEGSWHKERLGLMKVHDVGMDTLKTIGVWDSLSSEVQSEIINGVVQKNVEAEAAKEELVARLAVARASRKTKYANVPKEITCTECHNVISVVPSIIAKRVENKGMMLDDYVKTFKCQKCCPTKGRRKKTSTVTND